MKHKIKKRYPYIFVSLFACMSVFYFAKKNTHSAPFFVFRFDPVLSESMKKQIMHTVHSLHEVWAEKVCNELHAQFACLKSISYHCQADNSIQLHITAHDPCCIINQSFVLLDNACIVSKDFFSKQVTHALSSIYMNKDEIANYEQVQMLTRFLKKVPPEIIEKYTIAWQDEFNIQLIDKAENKFVIVCQADQYPDATMCLQCDQVKQELNEKRVFSHRTKTNWIADVRFENQIIVRADKGGTGNGSSIS